MQDNFNNRKGFTYESFLNSNDEYRRRADELKHRKKMNTIVILVVVIILGLAAASLLLFDDDFFIRPLMSADFRRQGYVTETVKEENITYLYCTDKETGGKVTLKFMKKGDLFAVDYSMDVENAFMRDESISSLKKHIAKSHKIISTYKKKLTKAENYPAYPIDYSLFDRYYSEARNSYTETNDGYILTYDFLGTQGYNGRFCYFTKIRN